ncbi:MAG: radical SAM protein, partial [Thermoplasmatota archaeon]
GKKFPSLSVTGHHCSLNCPHCEGKYLKNMIPVKTPDELMDEALQLSKKGAEGFLLSGGTDLKGRVPLSDYYPTLKDIKRKTDLIVNIHTGIPSEEDIELIKGSGIDVVSYDMIGSDETIDKIYGLGLDVETYKKGYTILFEAGIDVVPHVTVGLDEGHIVGEYDAIDAVSGSEKIILNSLIPSDFGGTVSKEDFLSVVNYAVKTTDADIIVGCMRERGRTELEIESVKQGVEGIVIPSKRTKSWAEKRYDVEIHRTCCAVQ